ncbi:hypothetical protein SAMN05660772_01151 [Pasteurella testudinis DSM 23072]|uniref:Uncharacterized protein n=1 Tax=Pasteurella testudinis DSM 23072 TaxID=1122938 RepID=A0A1W1V4E7_9PAST|nr:hypothetical protein [Pasteurella testudinis]SMB88269.1 hypothetical protein SAMN05660772_01151 [Pasteurella testudinis DSM 23072]SUB51146.1 Uncharacterised protein [Pasteurella testudinis]
MPYRNLPPYSPLARLLCAPWWLKSLLSLCSLLLLSAYPLLEIMQLKQQAGQNSIINSELQQEQRQKQQIIALLKQKAESAKMQLDPQTAAKIATLDQELQSAVAQFADLTIARQHWQFSRSPLLQLELNGSFYAISRFLITVQQQFGEVKLLSLALQHQEQQAFTQATLALLFSEESTDE